jgi:hypothetical protein
VHHPVSLLVVTGEDEAPEAVQVAAVHLKHLVIPASQQSGIEAVFRRLY